MKVCTKCRLEKPLDEFHKARKHKDGRSYVCKVCATAYQAAHKLKKLERYYAPYKEQILGQIAQWERKRDG